MSKDMIAQVPVAAGTTVKIEGIPFTLVNDTMLEGHRGNVAMLRATGAMPLPSSPQNAAGKGLATERPGVAHGVPQEPTSVVDASDSPSPAALRCKPCGTSWTVPVRDCPKCGQPCEPRTRCCGDWDSIANDSINGKCPDCPLR